jgi:DNA invertase Pin-like site-specific DNA recombinase
VNASGSAASLAAAVKPVRCAIYTRKSSEEGLDQAFNSLHAQRDACLSYIRSQVHEGWTPLDAEYDDGGFSGGSMERPALQQLLADIRAGLVDTIVVYKIDRLTRSLADFSKMVELFDAERVSFVSVTQQFNTTTSMGRLTLNVLLSFAQFEREVTGERIRDKIAASKARGMWMGGVAPLGYDPQDRKLVVNPGEAEQVRRLFERYLELRSVHLLKAEMDEQGVRSKAWVSSTGKAMGGARFSRGALFHLLQNRTYRGEIVHKDKVHPGLHEPIIDLELFEQVQALLQDNGRARRGRKVKAASSPLMGLLRDCDGLPMTPTFSYGKTGRLYRYYVSAALQQGLTIGRPAGAAAPLRRVSAPALEGFVLEKLTAIGGWLAWDDAAPYLRAVELGSDEVTLVVDISDLRLGARHTSILARLQERLIAGEEIVVEPNDLTQARIVVPTRAAFRGGRTWLFAVNGGAPASSAPDPTLVKGLQNAHALANEWGLNPTEKPSAFATARTPRQAYLRGLCRLVYLAPDLQRAILEGRHARGLTLERLLRDDFPLAWPDQRVWFRNL